MTTWRVTALTLASLLALAAVWRLAAPPISHPSIISERSLP